MYIDLQITLSSGQVWKKSVKANFSKHATLQYFSGDNVP